MDMDMRSAEAGCGQRASQGCNSPDFAPRLKSQASSLQASHCTRLPIVVLILLEGLDVAPARRAGQGRYVPTPAPQVGRDLERQERGTHLRTWGRSTWAYQQGGLPISVPFSRGVSPTGR